MKNHILSLNQKIKRVKLSFLTIVFLLQFNFVFSQTNICQNKYDSISILKYAQQKGHLLLPNGWTLETILQYLSMRPNATFDENKCQWKVVSRTYKQDKNGNCKFTNGCTIEILKTVIIDANTGRISTKKNRYVKHNNLE